jgi:hypothetical protein
LRCDRRRSCTWPAGVPNPRRRFRL